jgi:hypothetical protein
MPAKTSQNPVAYPKGWPAKMQGIVDSTNPKNFVRRVSDDEIHKTRRSPGNRKVYFQDCGLLMIDARRRPLLISAQGHGGCGTLGCVQLLSKFRVIDDCFARSAKSPLGSARIFEAVAVLREVRSFHEVDDATIKKVRVW